MDKRTGKFAAGALVVAVVGYTVGILTAQKSGKETRKDIKNAAAARITEAEKRLKKLHTDLAAQLKKAADQAQNLKGRAQDEAKVAIAKASTTKDKVRTALSAAHDGEASDKDLEKAIAEAEQAIGHLKKYLTK